MSSICETSKIYPRKIAILITPSRSDFTAFPWMYFPANPTTRFGRRKKSPIEKISETKTYTVNGKEYKLRTITYEDDYGTYVDLYFAYKLDDEYCYVVEVETEGGNISMDTIEYFLDATVE